MRSQHVIKASDPGVMIGWRDGDGASHNGSLFATFAALARGEAWSFPALRPHQREPWHAFTVQVAALALINAERDDLPGDEAAWRDLLNALTPDCPEAWMLVVDDWTKPALLQPPLVAATDRAAYKNRLPTPDALDMLVTAKNHDVKQERMAQGQEQEWLFALVTLQTFEGFLGAGNYGISRMNGGFANRMSLSVRPTNGTAAAFAWDVQRLVTEAKTRSDKRRMIRLLWVDPWDGASSYALGDLDELYVEICRRIRLVTTAAQQIEAVAASSKVARVAYKEVGGNTRDPWAPLTIDKKKESLTFGKLVSVTATAAGFGYDRISKLLDQRHTTPSPLMALSTSENTTGLSLVATALARGQGKTEGLHRRAIRIGGTDDGEATSIDRIGEIAAKRAGEASEASRLLRNALISLVQGGPDKARLDDETAKKKASAWITRFDRIVDNEFFDAPFWAEVSAESGDVINHRTPWRTRLRAIADETFERAADAAPHSEVRRIRARVRARSFLDGQMRTWIDKVRYGE